MPLGLDPVSWGDLPNLFGLFTRLVLRFLKYSPEPVLVISVEESSRILEDGIQLFSMKVANEGYARSNETRTATRVRVTVSLDDGSERYDIPWVVDYPGHPLEVEISKGFPGRLRLFVRNPIRNVSGGLAPHDDQCYMLDRNRIYASSESIVNRVATGSHRVVVTVHFEPGRSISKRFYLIVTAPGVPMVFNEL